MKCILLLISILIVQKSVAPPVTQTKKEEPADVDDFTSEYHRYLKEVVEALESDPDFRAKLEKAEEKDIINGKIADQLEYVSHHVRSKLDELKRNELERLRHLAIKEFELENGIDRNHLKIGEHIDHDNPHTFEIEDLKKLIAKTTKDLEEADRKRKESFKEYEMKKKFEQEEKMKNMTEEERKKYENELHELEKKHKDHEPLHHPGSKKQLEEVWEKQDHMENQDFDPRTFFFLHDLDGNGVWDQNELKTLFLKELDKIYQEGLSEDDLVERSEELERMREHVIKEADLNKDGLISYEEFLNESKKTDFEKDPGWVPLDEQQIYTEQEYLSYKQQKAREIAQAMSAEHHFDGQPQPGHEQFPPHPNDVYQGHIQQQAQYPQQVQHQQYPPNPNIQIRSQHQNQFNQVPQQGQHQQVPIQQDHFGQQVPLQQQQQFHPNQQVPVSNNMNQIPQQPNYQQVPVNNNQPPQQQFQQQQQQQQFQQQQFQHQQQQHQQFQQQQQQQQQQQLNQQPIASNNVNQQPIQQNQPSINNVPHLSDQQIPGSTGQNQQNTQNQVPPQANEQIASVNNAQTANQGVPNVVKT